LAEPVRKAPTKTLRDRRAIRKVGSKLAAIHRSRLLTALRHLGRRFIPPPFVLVDADLVCENVGGSLDPAQRVGDTECSAQSGDHGIYASPIISRFRREPLMSSGSCL
jgi:hypothetical protein